VIQEAEFMQQSPLVYFHRSSDDFAGNIGAFHVRFSSNPEAAGQRGPLATDYADYTDLKSA